MGIYGPPGTPKSLADSPATVVSATTAAVIVPANANRASGSYIINNATKIMWVSWGGTATAASPTTAVPANGGAIDFPNDFTGSVSAIWSALATGSCVIHEFTAA